MFNDNENSLWEIEKNNVLGVKNKSFYNQKHENRTFGYIGKSQFKH
ncbi:hypothetical protein Echvi_3065 [Echinicola vietnamensis DSM 17526]|uniref:Uncharacterized protein n=1 Tax=Echinicola vietnamensis (strain DSM 17526 / LMG 23754 / KMM 6221) TaxID=926556 RepID=L0G1W0_ECHVK|nr:hypothetical protein Echvi_3065 [Echinicola vietnamensis DSM 17526]